MAKMLKNKMKKQGRPNEYESAIVSIIKEAPKGTHLTAPEVFARAQQLGLPISVSTVYRTLHRLKTGGNVSTVSGDRKIRYESAEIGPEHDHLICLGCGLTIEFVDKRLPNFGQTVAKRKGFLVIKSRFDILGYCENCSNNSDKDKRNKIKSHVQLALKAASQSLQIVEKLNRLDLTEDKIALFINTNQRAIENLNQALENCYIIEKMLNRNLKPGDF